MTEIRDFKDILVVSPLADGRTWYLWKPFGYTTDDNKSIVVQAGFVTDFASVPRPLWWFLPPWGKYGNAAVIHDFCYAEQICNRKWADKIFLEAMKELGVKPFIRYVMYIAVRLFGWLYWCKIVRRNRPAGWKIAKFPPEKCTQTVDDLI